MKDLIRINCLFFFMLFISHSATADIGLIGPSGRTVLYFLENNLINVKICDSYTILGNTSKEAQQNCRAKKSYSISPSIFSEALKASVTAPNSWILSPLSSAEVMAQINPTPSDEAVQSAQIELKSLDAYAAQYGPNNTNSIRRIYLTDIINFQQNRLSAIQKISTEINTIFNLISSTDLHIQKFSENASNFSFNSLNNFDPTKPFPCGLVGNLHQRISDCSIQDSSRKGNFLLVSRDKNFNTIYQDIKTGYLWANLNHHQLNFEDANIFCKNLNFELKELGPIQWTLPTKNQFTEVRVNGLNKAIYSSIGQLWTSETIASSTAWSFNFTSGFYHKRLNNNLLPIRCIGH